jgi:allantoinase
MPPRPSDLAVRGERVVTPEGMRAAAVLVRSGRITAVVAPDDLPQGCEVIDAGRAVVMPGLCDTHVHVNEPGRTEWEGFHTATRAAAAGGITTLVDMPLNCIPVTTSRAAFQEKLAAILGLCWIDCGFWGGVIPGNADELDGMLDDGVLGFKCFLVHSGIDEFPNVTIEDLARAMPILERRGAPLLVHAELEHDHPAAEAASPADYATYLRSRPASMENEAIRLLIALCREHRCRVHVVHLSSAEALADLAAARREGLPITVETCPHYLYFAAEHIPRGQTQYKCAPPIREAENRERLWHALESGTLDFVVSDHSPCTPHLKRLEAGDFLSAWGGISSVQLALPAVWTRARARGCTVVDLVRWMCERPARFSGLDGRKGAIAPGQDADLVLWDPDAEFTVVPSMIEHKHKLTPYAGERLYGVVERTILRGETVYQRSVAGGVAGGVGGGNFLGQPRGMNLIGRDR